MIQLTACRERVEDGKAANVKGSFGFRLENWLVPDWPLGSKLPNHVILSKTRQLPPSPLGREWCRPVRNTPLKLPP